MWENPPFLSALIIVAILTAWISVKLTRSHGRFEKNEKILFETVTRLDRVESRLDRMETKLDLLLSYFFRNKTKETNIPQA